MSQPTAVAVLMVMHLAIALVTYNLLVHLAPVRPAAAPRRGTRRPELMLPGTGPRGAGRLAAAQPPAAGTARR